MNDGLSNAKKRAKNWGLRPMACEGAAMLDPQIMRDRLHPRNLVDHGRHQDYNQPIELALRFARIEGLGG
jgi:hypothetical protein